MEEEEKIISIKRNYPLVNQLMLIILCGFDAVFDQNGKLYIRLLCRLVDKSFDEYTTAREYLLEELKTEDKLAYRFAVVNHLENCINSLNRASLVFGAARGKSLGRLISKTTKNKIERLSVSNIRNIVEHIDGDIKKGDFKNGLFLDVDQNYENICINGNCISFKDLAYMIEQYHFLVLEIFGNLPNRREGDKFYYDKK